MVSVRLQVPGCKVRPLPLRLNAPTYPLPYSSAFSCTTVSSVLLTIFRRPPQSRNATFDTITAKSLQIVNDAGEDGGYLGINNAEGRLIEQIL